MPLVGVVGTNASAIIKAFSHISEINCVEITNSNHSVDVLVIAEAMPVLKELKFCTGSYLVVNSDAKGITPLLHQSGATLITYGFNSRACITASSITDDGLQVCIQRHFYGIDEEERQPQEFSIRLGYEESPENVLAAAAALAVFGI